ncbi:recombination mediator RecR [Candidatus Gromoviella agglomerans]|uniref:recombination mediator RecR n=1 Tax=Candidatus Gromoviella agglomerans TaxID=2806609 RepID=UPI001E65295B|nr:recombination mediator RecR [Candidatus Gromoviella agglomerans]UFX98142.1 Recombination protein RecR [Candidatus Gromoviella agglomerans]
MSKILDRLSNSLLKIPSLTNRSSYKIALQLLFSRDNIIDDFIKNLIDAKNSIATCSECYYICENGICDICSGMKRDSSKICVVSNIIDVISIERSLCYNGHYHVLHGTLSAVNGITPSDLYIDALLRRVRSYRDNQLEIIMSFSPTMDGHSTMHYLVNEIKSLGNANTIISTPAKGIPLGGELEHLDSATIHTAFFGRTSL